MKPQVPWLRVFVEGVVIVASILLALAADAWWQERQDRDEERGLLRALRSEFVENLEQLDQRISEHTRLAAANASLLEVLAETSDPEIVVADTMVYGLLVFTTYDPTLGTLEEAQSSGRTRLIQNRDIRTLLGAWPGLLEDAKEEMEDARVRAANDLRDVLLEAVDMSSMWGNVTEPQPPVVRWLIGERPYEDDQPSRVVPVSTLLTNYATRQGWAQMRSANELTGLRTQLDSLISLIDSEIGDQ